MLLLVLVTVICLIMCHVSCQSPPVFLGQSSPAVQPPHGVAQSPFLHQLGLGQSPPLPHIPPTGPIALPLVSKEHVPHQGHGLLPDHGLGPSGQGQPPGMLNNLPNNGPLPSVSMVPLEVRRGQDLLVHRSLQQNQQEQQAERLRHRRQQPHPNLPRQQQVDKWAPGEPVRTFPGDTRVRTCLQRGCPRDGTHCVFWGGICPGTVRGVPCRCERGCRVDNVFIPFGQNRVMDACNNVCRCTSRNGQASCTARRC